MFANCNIYSFWACSVILFKILKIYAIYNIFFSSSSPLLSLFSSPPSLPHVTFLRIQNTPISSKPQFHTELSVFIDMRCNDPQRSDCRCGGQIKDPLNYCFENSHQNNVCYICSTHEPKLKQAKSIISKNDQQTLLWSA